MKFFAIHLEDLESEAFTMASDEQAVTWLYLHAYCCKQMNGGEIENADKIHPKVWLRHGVEHHDLLTDPSPLWRWDDGTLVVIPYDHKGQEVFEKKSKGGKDGANKRWKGTPNGTPNGTLDAPDPTRTPTQPKPRKDPSNDPPLVPLAESIYDEFPRKVGRKDAINAIIRSLKKDKVSADDLMAKTKAFAESVKDRDKKFIPHASTWFKGERWQDELEAMADKPKALDMGRRAG